MFSFVSHAFKFDHFSSKVSQPENNWTSRAPSIPIQPSMAMAVQSKTRQSKDSREALDTNLVFLKISRLRASRNHQLLLQCLDLLWSIGFCGVCFYLGSEAGGASPHLETFRLTTGIREPRPSHAMALLVSFRKSIWMHQEAAYVYM